jgi:hypothetical protein
MLKSVVVLDIRIGKDGAPQAGLGAAIQRLPPARERAESSVRKAAPFSAPRRQSCCAARARCNFWKPSCSAPTGVFQILSLVETPR